MKQTNVAHNKLSEKFLERFEAIATKDNVHSIEVISNSIKIQCKCGCTHVEHFFFGATKTPAHYQRHFVELCETHKFTTEELCEIK